MTRSGKYGPLFDWFVALPATTNEVRLTFGKIEEIIGGALPQSAHDYDAWWTDASAGTTHVHALAESLRARVELEALPHPRSAVSNVVTVSVGVAVMVPAATHEPALLIDAADQALYRAKAAGRNRVGD